MTHALARTTLFLALLSLIACENQARWHPIASLAYPISNNAVTSVVHEDASSTLYSFMGITDPADPASISAQSYRLDLSSDLADATWRRIGDAPLLDGRAKIGASAISVGERIFLLGGYTVGGESETTEKRFFEYLPRSDTYARRSDVPVEVDDTVLGVYRDRFIYTISGWHGPTQTNVLDAQVYDTTIDQWSPATPMPAPEPGLFGHSGTIIGDTIIICDGVAIEPDGDGRDFIISDRVFVGRIDPSDPTQIRWTQTEAHPGSPTYRAGASQGAAGDARMFIVGGTDNPYNINGIGYDGEPSLRLKQILAFDPKALGWSSINAGGSWPATMDHRGLVRVGKGGWAIIGGMTAPGVTTSACWRLTIR